MTVQRTAYCRVLCNCPSLCGIMRERSIGWGSPGQGCGCLMWLQREPEGSMFCLFLLAMARRNKSLGIEEIGVCSSGTFSLGRGELGKGVNFAQRSFSHSVDAEQAGSAWGYFTSPGKTCQSLQHDIVHHRIVSLLKQLVLTPHHG